MKKYAFTSEDGSPSYTAAPSVDDMYVEGQTYGGLICREIPLDATDQEVLSVWYWGGEWRLRPPRPDQYSVWVEGVWIDPRPLTDLQVIAHTAIVHWRNAQEANGLLFDHAGRTWDGGLIVRQRLQPVLSLPALPPGFFWTDAGNEDVPVDMPALQSLAAAHEQALVIRGFEIHARQRAMKNALDSMTRDELLAFIPDWDIP